MTFQQHIVSRTQRAADEAFRYAKAVPADKLGWVPSEGPRSVLDICRELAMTPTWAYDTIAGVEFEHSEEALAKMKAMQDGWTTVEDCEAQYKERAAKMNDQFVSMSDEDLSKTRWLPYDGGRDFTYEEMMEYPSWNLNYHTGQIAYVQMLLGDKEMH